MFLTDKRSSLLPFHHHHHHHTAAAPPKPKPSRRQQQQQPDKATAARYEAALASRLRGLLPLPPSPLAALARVADLLALALADAAPALAGERPDAAAVAAHLDAGVALLDACNAIAARLDRLRRRRLLARFALHLLPSSPPRARAALDDHRAGAHAPSSPTPAALPSLPFDQPRGARCLSPAARVLVAVDAVSSLAAATAAAALGSIDDDAATLTFPRVSGGGAEFPWAEAFNAVSGQVTALAAGTSEVDAVDEAVAKLASALGGGVDDEAALRAAAQEVEERTEELSARLDRLSDAVNAVFRAALGLRNAELGSFMSGVGPAEKTCKK
ncbi:hypothetical protein U9M48_034275 [Paspalum notatum var. saurae]|uniref:Uncharacterized protein n=1 Tax=Paspalum notatum var. saurae TaxID=547442 RepID=A0AAQ3X7S7_PASNO